MRHLLLIIVATGLLHCGSSDSGSQPGDPSTGGAGFGGSGGAGGSDTGPQPTVHVDGSDGTKTYAFDFSGQATGESAPGVFCEYWNGVYDNERFMKVFAHDGYREVALEFWSFTPGDGSVRTETFTLQKRTVDITLKGGDSGALFVYNMPYSPGGGSCTTTIDSLGYGEKPPISGSITCNPLPGDGKDSTSSATVRFSCPLDWHSAY